MSEGMKTIIYPVKDLAKAKELFSLMLGIKPYIDQPYYVAFDAAGNDIGLDPNGHARGLTGSAAFWRVANLDECIAQLTALGARMVEEPKNVGGGNLVATVKDVDGNIIGLFQNA